MKKKKKLNVRGVLFVGKFQPPLTRPPFLSVHFSRRRLLNVEFVGYEAVRRRREGECRPKTVADEKISFNEIYLDNAKVIWKSRLLA